MENGLTGELSDIYTYIETCDFFVFNENAPADLTQ